MAKKRATKITLPVIPHRTILKKVPSGEIATERGADGTYLRFDCDCEHAIEHCHSMCCSLPGILVEEDEIERVEKAWAKVSGGKVPATERNHDDTQQVMKRDSDSWCRCLDRETRACRIYADRPATCRNFHCTRGEDARGWLFDLGRHTEFMGE